MNPLGHGVQEQEILVSYHFLLVIYIYNLKTVIVISGHNRVVKISNFGTIRMVLRKRELKFSIFISDHYETIVSILGLKTLL